MIINQKFEKIRVDIPVIFTTAFDKYAIKAFKVNSIDYLLKPVEYEDLKKAIQKYLSIYISGVDYHKIKAVVDSLQPKIKERFLIKVGEHYKSIQVSRINCFYTAFVLVCENKTAA